MRRVGVVGLGGMGIALTRALLDAEWSVGGYDVPPEPLAQMADLGAEPAADARELATGSDVVLTFLPGPREVRAVALDPRTGVLAGLGSGAAMLDMSTCGPDLATELGEAFDAA